MKKIIKRISGIILLLTLIPIIAGLCSLNGQLCIHGHCENVVPFWGGVMIGIQIDIFLALFLCVIFLIKWLLMSE